MQEWMQRSTWLRLLIFSMLALGIFFRFVNLDKKVYWPDETFTSLRISGYTQSEVLQKLYDGRVIVAEDLHKYQRPNSEKSVIGTIKGLALEEPQHTPLYYVMARFWAQCFGNSVAVTRSLSAWISLLAFPCIYWLCIELFHSSLTGWMAIALIAVSPFHVLYAQEARPYSLWTVAILLSSATILRAMRLKTKLSWGIYAATLSFSLYSFIFSGLVVIRHFIYVLIIEHFRLTQKVSAYLLASFISLLTLVPWLYAVVENISQAKNMTNWSGSKISLFSLASMWAGNLSRIFFDVGVGSDDPLFQLIPLIPPVVVILVLIAYALYFVCRSTPKRVWLFIVILISVTGLALLVPDLILGGRRSGVARYQIPCYLGIQLAVAHLLATYTTGIAATPWRRKLWQLAMLTLFTSSVFSCALSAQAQVWWNKGPDRTKYNPQVAEIVNQASQPLLISDTDLDIIQSLSYLLDPQVRLQLVAAPHIPKIADGFSDVFLYRPSLSLRSEITQKQGYKIEPAYSGGHAWLWKVIKP